MTTPLHAGLGEAGDELTFDLVKKAAGAGVEETDRLDWKTTLHLKPSGDAPADDTPLRLELAKDIAAMANTRGGLLVCGVREGTAGGPHTIEGLGDLSNGVEEKRIVQTAYSHIYPPVSVATMRLVGDADSPDAGKTVLVISIPESDDAPHLVRPKGDKREEGWMVAPVRAGRDTRNMVEKELETAYRQRFEGRRARERDLRESLQELADRHTLTPAEDDPGTVVAFAQPIRPRSGPLPGAHTAQSIISAGAMKAYLLVRTFVCDGREVDPRRFAVVEMMKPDGEPRRSLRRHISESRWGDESPEQGTATEMSIELHDDGSVGMTWRAGATHLRHPASSEGRPRPSIGASDMSAFAVALISLLRVVHDRLDLDGGYQLSVGLWPRNRRFLVIPDPDDRRAPEERVHVPPPLEAELRLDSSPETVARDVVMLALDLSSMVGQVENVFEKMWWGGGSAQQRDRQELAIGLFGGTPPHPITGRKFS